jgi:hypothetical protein
MPEHRSHVRAAFRICAGPPCLLWCPAVDRPMATLPVKRTISTAWLATEGEPMNAQPPTETRTLGPIPADDPDRHLTHVRPDTDESLSYIGVVGDTYTSLCPVKTPPGNTP